MRKIIVSALAAATLVSAMPASAAIVTGFEFTIFGTGSGSADRPYFNLKNTSTFGPGDAASSAYITGLTLTIVGPEVFDYLYNPSDNPDSAPALSYTFLTPNGGTGTNDQGNTSNNSGASGTTAAIAFGGFNVGDVFKFRADIDPGENNDFRTAFDKATLSVTFANGDTATTTLGNFAPRANEYTFNGTGAVPEPASWSMMIIGFGFAGHAMRRRTAGARQFA